jgi:hypothetical protein
LTTSSADNTFSATYPIFDDTANRPSMIDILVTVPVSSVPFTDNLALTNLAASTQGTTNNSTIAGQSMNQVKLGQPDVKIKK